MFIEGSPPRHNAGRRRSYNEENMHTSPFDSLSFPGHRDRNTRRRNSSSNTTTIVDPIAFAKSQVALNSAYKLRRQKYNQTPLSARIETGKNLKNLQPLAVRAAEFC